MSDDKVIHAFPSRELPECPVSIERRAGYCQHARITLVEHDRNIVCAECGRTLDPFDYLLKEAFAIRRGWDEARHLAHLLVEKRQQVADLDKERKRLQAQVRRLKEKPGTTLDVRKPL